jgi:hypothetical protein
MVWCGVVGWGGVWYGMVVVVVVVLHGDLSSCVWIMLVKRHFICEHNHVLPAHATRVCNVAPGTEGIGVFPREEGGWFADPGMEFRHNSYTLNERTKLTRRVQYQTCNTKRRNSTTDDPSISTVCLIDCNYSCVARLKFRIATALQGRDSESRMIAYDKTDTCGSLTPTGRLISWACR